MKEPLSDEERTTEDLEATLESERDHNGINERIVEAGNEKQLQREIEVKERDGEFSADPGQERLTEKDKNE